MGRYSFGFKCGNCQHKWTRMIETGKKVVHSRTRNRVKIMPEDSIKTSETEIIECPNCEVKSSVRPRKPSTRTRKLGGQGWAM